jgi:hypothetical protein
MKNRKGLSLRGVTGALVFVILLEEVMWASGWTTVGSAGTVDEGSTSIVGLRGPFVELKNNCFLDILGIQRWCRVATGILTVRYNIVPTGTLNITSPTGFAAYEFTARFRDTGNAQRVLLMLKEVNLQSGGETTILTVDSDSFSASPDYQTQLGPRTCGFTFDFVQNAYYVEAQISNSSGTGPSPGLETIWINRCPTL